MESSDHAHLIAARRWNLGMMKRQTSWLLLLLFTFAALIAPALAACNPPSALLPAEPRADNVFIAPKSFCKCTCNGVSKIFDLDAPSTPEIKRQASGDGVSRKKTCNDCNRQYCMSYAFCSGVKEENVVTTCFREWLCVHWTGEGNILMLTRA